MRCHRRSGSLQERDETLLALRKKHDRGAALWVWGKANEEHRTVVTCRDASSSVRAQLGDGIICAREKEHEIGSACDTLREIHESTEHCTQSFFFRATLLLALLQASLAA